MVNNTNDSKLDQTVKQTLSNYEAPYDAADWAKMESMLNSTPASTNFNWSYTVKIFISLIVLGGGYLFYHSLNSSKTTETIDDPTPQQSIENKVNAVTTKPVTIPTPSVPVSSATKETSQPSESITPSPAENVVIKNENVQKETVVPEKDKNNMKSEAASVKEEKDKKSTKRQQVLKMGNEPIFGDMLDSSKGIIGNTKEKEATKKAAQKQPSAIGWSSFILQNNLDSLKKYHLQQQKDSLKK